jgi:hypothetical protein
METPHDRPHASGSLVLATNHLRIQGLPLCWLVRCGRPARQGSTNRILCTLQLGVLMTSPNRTENYRFIEIHCHRTEAESVAHACEDLPALLAVVTAERDQARQMLADAEKKIASMELDESLREEDERFADPL